MSNVGTPAPAAPVENNEAVEMFEKYNKKGKMIVLKTDNQEAFLDFTSKLATYQDLASQAPASFTGGYAMVETEKKLNRLIALPSMEDVFSDPITMKALYKMYVSRKVSLASDDDANPADFITVAGGFKQKFDLEAFKFQAKTLSKFLRDMGLSGVTNSSLRLAFMSEAFAASQFPRLGKDKWDKLLGVAEAMAAKHGYDTSIFDHWKATRAVASADTSEIELDFDALQKAEDAITVDNAESTNPAATA